MQDETSEAQLPITQSLHRVPVGDDWHASIHDFFEHVRSAS